MRSELRLLLIDEQSQDRALAGMVLGSVLQGAEVEEVGGEADFVRSLEGGPFDLVVTEYTTSWATGPLLIRTIRNRQPSAGLVVLTRVPDRDCAVAAMKAGATDFMVKSPSGLMELAQAVGALRGGSLAEPAPSALDWTTSNEDSIAEPVPEEGDFAETLAGRLQELEVANSDLSEFAYIASHELREPLRVVEKHGELLAASIGNELPDSDRESLGFVVDGARRMHRLVDDLLAFCRVGAESHDAEPCDLGEVVERALGLLRPLIEVSGAHVYVEKLPTVQGSPAHLGQVFTNLLGNALKFRGDVEPEVRVSADRRGNVWRISIQDNGIGIALADQERIFNIFTRLHPKLSGTGIGLAVARRIVDRHDGSLWVESTPGVGSIFHFTLPAWEGDAGQETTDASREGGE